MADYSTLDNSPDPLPSTGASTDPDALGLTIPGSVLTGTSAGIQQLGGPSMFADNSQQHIVVAPGGTPQVVMGNQATFGEGFYVAKTGVNALTNTDPSQWIFNSNQDVFKIIKTGNIIIPGYTTSSTAGVFTTNFSDSTPINHGLTYQPAFLAYLLVGSTSYYSIPFTNSSGSGATFIQLSITLTVTSSVVQAHSQETVYGNTFDTNSDITVKYYLLQESAS